MARAARCRDGEADLTVMTQAREMGRDSKVGLAQLGEADIAIATGEVGGEGCDVLAGDPPWPKKGREGKERKK